MLGERKHISTEDAKPHDYSLYVARNQISKDRILYKLRGTKGNAVILFPDGASKYKACFIQKGEWRKDKKKLKEVTMGDIIISAEGLLSKETTPNYLELINMALKLAEIDVPRVVTMRLLQKDMNDPETRAAFTTPALDELERLEHPVSASSSAAVVPALIKKQKQNNATSTTEYIKTPEVKTVLLPVPTHLPINTIIPEVGIDRLPDDVQSLCIEYAAEPNIEEKNGDPIIQVRYSPMSFFNKNLARRLFDAANALHHDGILVPALNLVRDEGPRILEYETTCIDRFGRCLRKKTLIQIAGMDGDVDYLQKYIPKYFLNLIKEDTPRFYKYKKHGAVELLAEAGGLTDDVVAKQLYPVLFSSEAGLENKIRKQRILDIFIAFGERILAKKDAVLASGHIKAAQRICREDIDRLKDDVMCAISHENITKGQVLDPYIMIELDWWYWHYENQLRFNGYPFKFSLLSGLFWLHSIGMLQYIATPSDARIYLRGISAVYRDSKYRLPGDGVFNEPIARTLKNVDEFSHFYPPSRLGLDYCLDERGRSSDYFPFFTTIQRIEELCKAKKASLKKFNTVSEQLAHYFCLR